MRTSSLIIGILIIGFFITGFYAVVNELASDTGGYNVNVDDSYEAAFANSENISNAIADDWQEMANYTTNKGINIGIVTLVPDVLSTMKNSIFLPLNLMAGIATSVQTYMGLPKWITTAFLTLFSIMAIFALAALILRYRYV